MKQQFDLWVDKVLAYATEVSPQIKRNLGTMQSKPFFDRQSEILFLGINPAEDGTYTPENVNHARQRFYEGNSPEVWGKLRRHERWNWVFNPDNPYNSFTKAGWGEAVKPDNYLFFNVIFFGSPHGGTDIKGCQDVIHRCVELSAEAITNIFRPRCVICFSVPQVFDRLNGVIHFNNVQRLQGITLADGTPVKHRVVRGEKDGIRFYGLPHFTGYWKVTKSDFDAIIATIHNDMSNF